MSAIILGEKARENHGLSSKYVSGTLNSVYKGYIDTLETAMMTCVYDNVYNECVVTRTFDLVMTQEDIDNCIGEQKYYELESAIIHFCQMHKCLVKFSRGNITLDVIVDMKLPFNVLYI